MNSFGRIFRVTIFGESHGERLGVVLDGVRAGMDIARENFDEYLSRRRSTGKPGQTPRLEQDMVQIVSGIYNGKTTGAPLTLMFENKNTKSSDYKVFESHPRPSHADFTASAKFAGWNDPRGSGHFSGRLTLPLVAAGVVGRKMCGLGVEFLTSMVSVGGETDPVQIDQLLERISRSGDSVGAVVECRVRGLEVGLGEPFFDSAESVISHLLFSIPGVKGVEFGSGFGSCGMLGSEHNDLIINDKGATKTNNAGGVVGGLTNGNDLVVRVAFKPTSSISVTQMTYNKETQKQEPLLIAGRHDGCIALRGAVVAEAALAIALADLMMINKKR